MTPVKTSVYKKKREGVFFFLCRQPLYDSIPQVAASDEEAEMSWNEAIIPVLVALESLEVAVEVSLKNGRESVVLRDALEKVKAARAAYDTRKVEA